jgi:hypothetical protein
MQLCFVSVHSPRETYFVDEPRSLSAVKRGASHESFDIHQCNQPH